MEPAYVRVAASVSRRVYLASELRAHIAPLADETIKAGARKCGSARAVSLRLSAGRRAMREAKRGRPGGVEALADPPGGRKGQGGDPG